METVFDLFKETEYAYVPLNRGTVFGNVQSGNGNSPKILKGVFKLRRGFARVGNNMELEDTRIPILHAHPEDYSSENGFTAEIGNGIVIDGVQYEITNISQGKNFDNGAIEHLTFTLQEVEYAD